MRIQPDTVTDNDRCPDGQCDMRYCDDSFDHLFGTQVLPPYLECNICGCTADLPEEEY